MCKARISFSSEVRKELCASDGYARHCLLSELAAILNISGLLTAERIDINTENELVVKRCLWLLKTVFQIEGDIINYKHHYTVTVNDTADVTRVLNATGCIIKEGGMVTKDVSPVVVMGQCCKRAYVRGSFIAGGTLSDPQKTYHLEFNLPATEGYPPENRGAEGFPLTQKLSDILSAFGLHPKTLYKKTHSIVYVKESENIVDALNIMEAHKSLLQLENVRILKEISNAVNRKVNFETANLNKTVSAAVGQIEDIRFISEHAGLEALSKPLAEVARLRINNEAASLKEIGAMLTPPVGKSGVNHRLRKISEIAEALRQESGGGI